MVNHFAAKTAMYSPTVVTRARNESGASPGKDGASNEPPLASNGAAIAEESTGTSKKKNKKNKKRNSRASLTIEDVPVGDLVDNGSGDSSPVTPGEEEEAEVAGDPFEPLLAPTSTRAPPPPPPVSAGSPFDEPVAAKEETSSLLDLPSPVAVSSGSPFDVFNDLATNTSSKAPTANTAPDLADLFGSPAPVETPPLAEPVAPAPVYELTIAPHVEVATSLEVTEKAPEPFVAPEAVEVAATPDLSSLPHAEVLETPEPTVVAAPESIVVETAVLEPSLPPAEAIDTYEPASVAALDTFDIEEEVHEEIVATPEPAAAVVPEPTVVDATPESVPTPESVATPDSEAIAITESIAEFSSEPFVTEEKAELEMAPPPTPELVHVDSLVVVASPPEPESAANHESVEVTADIDLDVEPEPVNADAKSEAVGLSEPILTEDDLEPVATPQYVESTNDAPTVDALEPSGNAQADVFSSITVDTAVELPEVSETTIGDSVGDLMSGAVENDAEALALDSPVESSPRSPGPDSLPSSPPDASVPSEVPQPPKKSTISPPGAPQTSRARIAKIPTTTSSVKPPVRAPVNSKVSVSTTPKATTPPAARTSPSAATSRSTQAATRTAVAKTPMLQRPLTGSTVAKKVVTKTPPKAPGQSPTGLAAKPASTSPKPPSPSGDVAGTDVKPVKKKLSASEIDTAGNRLYEQAMESKRRLEEKKALREGEFSFTPQVNAKSKKLDKTDASDRFTLLHERAKEAQRKKEELREKLEKEQCTFKPQITNKAKKVASSSDKPRYENLYKNALEIQAKREERKKQETVEEELTFKPKINTTKSPVKSRPLYDPELVKQRRLEIEQKKLEAEQQSKPKPVRKTKPADGESKIFDRLYQAGQQRAERIAKLKQEREEQEKAKTTFQPKVSAAAASVKTSAKPFHERLYDKEYLKRVAAEREQKKIEEEKKRFSFKPQVSEIPDSAKSKGSNEGGSTGKSSIFERLYQDKDRVKEKIEMSEELKVQKEMEECTFRPQIEVPTSVGSKNESTTPIWERLLSIDKNQIADERERQKAQQELEACTFRPEISGAPGSLSPKRTSTSSIFERLSTSAGNTPVDDKKRRPSERKSLIGAQGKRNSYNERGFTKPNQAAESRSLSVSEILKSSKLNSTAEESSGEVPSIQARNGSTVGNGTVLGGNIARSLEVEFNEEAVSSQSKSILENYDTWAANLEEKMRNL